MTKKREPQPGKRERKPEVLGLLRRIYVLRRERLELLIKSAGSQRALAERVEKDPNYISRAVSKGRNRKLIGEEFARELEFAFDKPLGWMDGLVEAAPTASKPETPVPWPIPIKPKEWAQLSPGKRKDIQAAVALKYLELRDEHERPQVKSNATG